MSRIFGPIRQNGYVVRDIEAAHGWDGTDPLRRLQRLPMRETNS